MKIEDLTPMASPIANKRLFLERAQLLAKKTAPDLGDLSAVCEALSAVATDELGISVRVKLQVDLKAAERASE